MHVTGLGADSSSARAGRCNRVSVVSLADSNRAHWACAGLAADESLENDWLCPDCDYLVGAGGLSICDEGFFPDWPGQEAIEPVDEKAKMICIRSSCIMKRVLASGGSQMGLIVGRARQAIQAEAQSKNQYLVDHFIGQVMIVLHHPADSSDAATFPLTPMDLRYSNTWYIGTDGLSPGHLGVSSRKRLQCGKLNYQGASGERSGRSGTLAPSANLSSERGEYGCQCQDMDSGRSAGGVG